MADTSQELVQYYMGSSLRIWYNDISVDYEPHWHTALEIIVPVENWYDATVQDEHFHQTPGDILIIPPGEMHSLKAPEMGNRYIFLLDLSPFSKLQGFAGIKLLLSRPVLLTRATHPNIYDDVYQMLMQMKNEYYSQRKFTDLMIYSLLLHIFVKLGTDHLETAGLFPGMQVHKQKEYVDKFNSVMDYIDTHYTEDLNLDSIADSAGFSKYHFSRLFKQYTNYTLCAYITHRRIKIAEGLLEQSALSITDVSLQSGFHSISTFNRVFKQIKGCTPSEYREKNSSFRDNCRMNALRP